MRRRELLIAGGAVLLSRAAVAEEAARPLVTFLGGGPTRPEQLAAFLAALATAGYVNGRNVTVKTVSANNDFSRLPALAAELAKEKPAVFVMPTGLTTSPGVIAATGSIPIVFLTGADPVALGIVPSLNRPGGKLTGVLILTEPIVGKDLELLNELCPGDAPLAVLGQSNVRGRSDEVSRNVAESLRRQVLIKDVTTPDEIERSFAELSAARAAGVAVPGLPLFSAEYARLVALAARYRMPAIYQADVVTMSGGLLSYGTSPLDMMRQLASDVARILSGVSPADIPIVQPERFRLVINLKTAKALGLLVPSTLLARADRVIE